MFRCPWAKTELYIQYHDAEWGVPVHDDRLLFEFLILEGAQAGLSWETILKKRENYRRAFDNFDFAIVAGYGQKKCRRLLADVGMRAGGRRHLRSADANQDGGATAGGHLQTEVRQRAKPGGFVPGHARR